MSTPGAPPRPPLRHSNPVPSALCPCPLLPTPDFTLVPILILTLVLILTLTLTLTLTPALTQCCPYPGIDFFS